ncbi:uncharacterized protein LY89DRAFT_679892 [Mollisia scopiformis]|uniref:Uncharacterized protein n=1 Tax=Mollisia scopiformis TaxID=149040 RepID=A0A194XSF7_MOLSC|nr:uncharacterized protein LY89DRAFT_679892 [Mollisia scopiformis]KUJ23076.1 hypothetical protein LY89DRAFT_679892 [Mollisia scopiformis]
MATASASETRLETPRKESTGVLGMLKNLISPTKKPTPTKVVPQEDQIMEESDDVPEEEEMANEPPQETLAPLPPANSEESEQDSPIALMPPVREYLPRKNTYDVDESDEHEKVSPRKRAKHMSKSKAPLVMAKTSKGLVPGKQHQTRGKGSVLSVPTVNGRGTSSRKFPVRERIDEEAVTEPSTPRKGRGRPKKNAASIRASEVQETEAVVEDTRNVDGILLDPGPENPANIPTTIQRVHSKRNPESLSQMMADYSEGEEAPAASGEDQEHFDQEENDNGEENEENGSGEEEDELLDDAEDHLIKIRLLRDMLSIANQVGHKDVNGEWRWQEVAGNIKDRRETPLTEPGKRIKKKVEDLIRQCRLLEEAQESDPSIPDLEAGISSRLVTLGEELEGMRKPGLEIPEDEMTLDEMTLIKETLLDTYFNIVPGLLKVIVAYAEAKLDRGSMEDHDLAEFQDLCRWLFDLASSALKHPPRLQPKAAARSKGISYRISQPTRSVLAQLGPFLQKLDKELASRQRAEEAAERRRLAPGLAKKREEEEARMRTERRRALNQLHREQWAALERIQNDPERQAWRRVTSSNPQKDALRSSYRSSTNSSQRNPEQEIVDEDDPFSEDDRRQAEEPSRSSARDAREQERIRREERLREQEKIRLEDEARWEQERARERKELHKLQHKVFQERLRERFDEPFWGQVLYKDIVRAEEARALSQSRSRSQTIEQNGHAGEDDNRADNDPDAESDDPFADEDAPKPQKVFDYKRGDHLNNAKPVSDQEKDLFVEMMMHGHGDPNRYQRAAQRLQRTMDEIFAMAKDFQEAMDAEHEKGNINEECDKWTYSVWQAPNSEAT